MKFNIKPAAQDRRGGRLDRRGAAENRHQHPQRVALRASGDDDRWDTYPYYGPILKR